MRSVHCKALQPGKRALYKRCWSKDWKRKRRAHLSGRWWPGYHILKQDWWAADAKVNRGPGWKRNPAGGGVCSAPHPHPPLPTVMHRGNYPQPHRSDPKRQPQIPDLLPRCGAQMWGNPIPHETSSSRVTLYMTDKGCWLHPNPCADAG